MQTLLLIVTFQQASQRSISSWTFHALAVKAAIEVGLHSPQNQHEHGTVVYDRKEAELRARIWKAIIINDRYAKLRSYSIILTR